MFGINFLLEKIGDNASFIDGVINNILKRSDEKKLFKRFLESETYKGARIIDVATKISSLEAEKLLEEGKVIGNDVLLDFAVSSLKAKSNGHFSIYNLLVRKIVEDQNPKFAALHRQIDRGKFDGSLPFGYPDAAKNAVGILTAKIKDSLDNLRPDYLKRKLFGEKVRSLAREMFYGINRLALSEKNLVRYLGLVFELSLLQNSPVENEETFKSKLSDALANGETLEVVHIKSLRFTYPNGKKLEIIEHLGKVETGGIGQERRFYHDEEIIIKRLEDVVDIFEFYGIKTNLTVLVADNDLEILFPDGNSLVSSEEVMRARRSARRYIGNLRAGLGGLTPKVYLLKSFLKKFGLAEYYHLRSNVFERLKNGNHLSLSESLIEERVNRQYEHYRDMFGKYSRSEARSTAYNQIANNMALSLVFRSFGNVPIVIIDNRGEENKFVGGLEPKERVLLLTKLKEPTIIEK